MGLAQLIYVSRRTAALTEEALHKIVARTVIANAARDITGVLLCCGIDLMQLLEGDITAVMSLYEKIRNDVRHSDVHCLLCKNVDKRLFPEWSMGLADLRAKVTLNRDRMERMIDDVRLQTETGGFSVEARILITDFRRQLSKAA